MKRLCILALLCAVATPASAYMRFRVEERTLDPTPVQIGDGSGRLCITVKNGGASGTANLRCRPCAIPVTEFWPLTPGEQYTWGANYKESFSAQEQLCCHSVSGSQTIYISEEGNLTDWTPTPTPTSTPTPTP